MVIDDPAELKLIEKYREILGKRMREGDPEISRTFTVPDQGDSDVRRHVSVGVRLDSGVTSTSSMELRQERAKVPEKYRPPCSLHDVYDPACNSCRFTGEVRLRVGKSPPK